jgi:tetratricopeptide (TPR) repeat protein
MTLLMAACVTSQSGKQLASLFYNVGNDYFDLGKYDKAIEAYQNALQADPGMVKADYNLALTLVRMKRVDEAVVILKRLLADDQKNTTLMAALGWAYHEQGKDKDALDQYNAVLALSPADQNALYNSGIILWKLTKNEDALERFHKVLVYASDDTDALFAAGSLLLSLDRPQDSADMLSRYVAKKTDDIDAWYLIAAGAERLLKYSRALEAYDKIVTIDPKQANAWFGEARLLLTVVEDPEKGLDALDKALSAGFMDKDAVKALLASGQLLERDRVEAAFSQHDLMPPEQPKGQAADQSTGQTLSTGQSSGQPAPDAPKPNQ